ASNIFWESQNREAASATRKRRRKRKKKKKKRKISYLISLLPAIRDPEKRRQPGGARGSSLSSPPP
uniref:Uncharacterized protein n=1 Tax=Oryza brachyantha TaxID=4533 RepID=J3LS35_ORYBR